MLMEKFSIGREHKIEIKEQIYIYISVLDAQINVGTDIVFTHECYSNSGIQLQQGQ